ncbi:MAG: zinc-ribbon domain-containing protein [Clostridiales bacterium]|nr:zinc-ribbon domain-containing protein [Clostridiales bacterium]
MSFLENIGKAAQTTVKKSGELFEVTKLNMSVNTETDIITKLYAQAGKLAYEKFKAEGSTSTECKDICGSIGTHEESIRNYKLRILELKKMKACFNCGAEIEITASFCAKCGARQEAVPQDLPQVSKTSEVAKIPVPQPASQTPVAQAEPPAVSPFSICPLCRANVSQSAKFCNSCGSKMIAGKVDEINKKDEEPYFNPDKPEDKVEVKSEDKPEGKTDELPVKEFSGSFLENYPKYKSGEMLAADFAKLLGISKPTLYKRIKEYEGRS